MKRRSASTLSLTDIGEDGRQITIKIVRDFIVIKEFADVFNLIKRTPGEKIVKLKHVFGYRFRDIIDEWEKPINKLHDIITYAKIMRSVEEIPKDIRDFIEFADSPIIKRYINLIPAAKFILGNTEENHAVVDGSSIERFVDWATDAFIGDVHISQIPDELIQDETIGREGMICTYVFDPIMGSAFAYEEYCKSSDDSDGFIDYDDSCEEPSQIEYAE